MEFFKWNNYDIESSLTEKNKTAVDEVCQQSEHIKKMCTHLLVAEKRLKDYLGELRKQSQQNAREIDDAFRFSPNSTLQFWEMKLQSIVTVNIENSEATIKHLLEDIETKSKKLNGLLNDVKSCMSYVKLKEVENLITELKNVEELPLSLEDIPLDNSFSTEFDVNFGTSDTVRNFPAQELKLGAINDRSTLEGIPDGVSQTFAKNLDTSADTAVKFHWPPVTEFIPAGMSMAQSPRSQIPTPPHPKDWTFLQQDRVILLHSNNPSNFWLQLESSKSYFNWLNRGIQNYKDRQDEPCLDVDVVIGNLYLARCGKDNCWLRVRVLDVIENPSGNISANNEVEICKDDDDDAVDFDEALTERLINFQKPEQPAYENNYESELSVKILHIDFGSEEIIQISRLHKIPFQFSQPLELAFCCGLAEIEAIDGVWSDVENSFFECYCENKVLMMTVICKSDSKLQVELSHVSMSDFNDTPGSARQSLSFYGLAKFRCSNPRFLDRPVIKKYYKKAALPNIGTSKYVAVTHVESPEKFFVQQASCESTDFEETMSKINNFYENLNCDDDWIIYNPVIGMPCVAKYKANWCRTIIKSHPGDKQLVVDLVDFGNSCTLNAYEVRRMKSDFMTLPLQAFQCELVDIQPKLDCWTEEATTALVEMADHNVFRMSVVGFLGDKMRVSLLKHLPEYEQIVNISSELVRLGHARISSNRAESTISAYKHLLDKTRKTEDGSSKNSPPCPEEYLPVNVIHVKDPSEIIIQLKDTGMRAPRLLTAFQEWCIEGRMEIGCYGQWAKGDYGAVYVEEESMWCRCKIQSIKSADVFEVWLVDYSYCIDVKFDRLKIIDPTYLDDNPYLYNCHLENIIPPGGSDRWPESSVNFLKDHLKNSNVFMLAVEQNDTNHEPVDLYMRTLTVGGALDPTYVTFASIREAIVGAGFAIPLEKIQENPVVQSTSVHKWLGAIQPNGANFKCAVIPSHVDDNGIIYLHKQADESRLGFITSALTAKFEYTKPNRFDLNWCKDEPCAVYLARENKWHRGEVVEVKPEVKVFFIDYGFSEILKTEHLRKGIFLTEIHQLCWPCKIYGIKPKNDNEIWSKAVVDFMRTNIVNRLCEMKVLVPSRGKNVMEIALMLPSNDDLGQVLVSKDYAVFDKPDSDCVPDDMDQINNKVDNCYSDFPNFCAFPELMLPPIGEKFPIIAFESGFTPDLVLVQPTRSESPQTEYEHYIDKHFLDMCNMWLTLDSKAPYWPLIENIKPGTPCCSRYSIDGKWYRAIVLYCMEASMCQVLFVDYGNREIVSTEDIKALPTEFLYIPRQHICCKLHRVAPISEDGWSEDAVREFNSLWTSGNHQLFAHVKVSSSPIEVDITYEDSYLCYQHLIDKGIVKSRSG